MIRTRDAVLLARTKLKTRRIRLIILLITMSVLFAGLVFMAEVASGTFGSLLSFGKEGFGSRYLVQATPMTFQQYSNNSLIDQVKAQQEQLIAQKKALAKKLELNYDPKADGTLYYTNQQTGPNPSDVQPVLNSSKLANDALNNQNDTIPGVGFVAFTARAVKAGAIATYRSTSTGLTSFNTGTGSGTNVGLQVLNNGREEYTSSSQAQQGDPTGLKTIQTLGWNQTSNDLLKPFLLKHQHMAVGSDGSIPIIAPFSAAEQLLGLPKLPATASTEQKLQRLVEVRTKIAGKQAELCYRNQDSAALLQKVIQQKADIAANKRKADYTPPHLQYNLPSEACGATSIKSDKRTAEEKTADNNQAKFEATFGQSPDPQQGIVKLRIVGLTPDLGGTSSSISAGGILSSVFSSSVGNGWYSPSGAFVADSFAAQAQGGTIDQKPVNQLTYYAEFKSLESAKSFIKQNDCNNGKSTNFGSDYNPNADLQKCIAKDKIFIVIPYGNNAGAISDIQHTLWKFGRFVILAVMILSVIVMMGTFGKVIADSRRETAVFRSLGASRLAVSQIYLTYTIMVGLAVGALALILGTIAATLVNNQLSAGLSINAVLTYNAADVHKQFKIIGFNGWYLMGIMAVVLISALISAVIPLALNMRRNPIRDMRDE